MAGCARRNGGSLRRMARDADEVRFYLRALHEAYHALEASGSPVTPRTQLKVFRRPNWLQIASVWMASLPYWVDFVVDRYAEAQADEIRGSYDHLISLAEHAGTDTHALQSLRQLYPMRE